MKKDYPRKFDTSNLDGNQKQALADFYERRKFFKQMIEEQKLGLFTCPGCGYPMFTEQPSDDICRLCRWQDDGQDDHNADAIRGGPNYKISLTQSRLLFGTALQFEGIDFDKSIASTEEEIFTLMRKYHEGWRKIKKGYL